jgi:acyl carrier protein
MTNREKLKNLLMDVFLLEEEDFHFDLKREEIPTWDSLGTVSMAVGVEETFGYHFTQEEALSIQSIPDIVKILEARNISFHE